MIKQTIFNLIKKFSSKLEAWIWKQEFKQRTKRHNHFKNK